MGAARRGHVQALYTRPRRRQATRHEWCRGEAARVRSRVADSVTRETLVQERHGFAPWARLPPLRQSPRQSRVRMSRVAPGWLRCLAPFARRVAWKGLPDGYRSSFGVAARADLGRGRRLP